MNEVKRIADRLGEFAAVASRATELSSLGDLLRAAAAVADEVNAFVNGSPGFMFRVEGDSDNDAAVATLEEIEASQRQLVYAASHAPPPDPELVGDYVRQMGIITPEIRSRLLGLLGAMLEKVLIKAGRLGGSSVEQAMTREGLMPSGGLDFDHEGRPRPVAEKPTYGVVAMPSQVQAQAAALGRAPRKELTPAAMAEMIPVQQELVALREAGAKTDSPEVERLREKIRAIKAKESSWQDGEMEDVPPPAQKVDVKSINLSNPTRPTPGPGRAAPQQPQNQEGQGFNPAQERQIEAMLRRIFNK